MITELTKEQEQGIKDWQKKCLAIGRDTSPINKDLTESSWKKFYKVLDKGKPEFWYCQSPMQAQIIINLLRSNLENNIGRNLDSNIRSNIGSNIESNIESNIWSNIESNIESNIGSNIGSNIRNNIWSNIDSNIDSNIGSNIESNNSEFVSTYSWCQHDISWIAYYKFYKEYGLLQNNSDFNIIDIWFDLASSCGWCYTFENIVFVCEKPNELHINEQGQLHKDGDMALKYSDGYGLYMLNGVNVPEELVTTNAEKLSLDFFNNEKNADVRTEFVRKYGIERMLHLGKEKDSYKNYSNKWWDKSEYKLIDMGGMFESIDYAPYLYMKNQTTGVFHLEGIHPRCRNLNEALAWRNGIDPGSTKILSIA